MSAAAYDIARPIGDVIAVSTTVGTILAILPPLAALFTIIWTIMRIVEMITGKPFNELIKRK